LWGVRRKREIRALREKGGRRGLAVYLLGEDFFRDEQMPWSKFPKKYL